MLNKIASVTELLNDKALGPQNRTKRCDGKKCNGQERLHVVTPKLKQYPSYLCVAIKRFTQCLGNKKFFFKNSSPVSIPEMFLFESTK